MEKTKCIIQKTTENVKLKDENNRLKQKLKSIQLDGNNSMSRQTKHKFASSQPTLSLINNTSDSSISEASFSAYSALSTPTEPEPQPLSPCVHVQKQTNIDRDAKPVTHRIFSTKRSARKQIPTKPLPPLISVQPTRKQSAQSDDLDDEDEDEDDTKDELPFIHHKTNTYSSTLSTISAFAVNEPLPNPATPPLIATASLSPIAEMHSDHHHDHHGEFEVEQKQRKQVIATSLQNSDDDAGMYHEWNQSIAAHEHRYTISDSLLLEDDYISMTRGELEGVQHSKQSDLVSNISVDVDRLLMMDGNVEDEMEQSSKCCSSMDFDADQQEEAGDLQHSRLSSDTSCDENAECETETISMMTENQYLLMELSKSRVLLDAMKARRRMSEEMSASGFSEMSSGNASHCDLVVESPINFRFSEQATLQLTVCNSDQHTDNNEDVNKDEKAPAVAPTSHK